MKIGCLRIAALAALAVMSLTDIAHAISNNLTWDPSVSGGSATGGAGTWNATNGNWANSASADVTWNSNNYNAIFNGVSGGAVSLVFTTTANTLTFNTTGYTISGSNALTLSGGSISVAPGAGANINSPLVFGSSSVNLTMLGGGTASLGAKLTPSASGTINIGAGTLIIAQTSTSAMNFMNGGVLNGNLVVATTGGIRLNFNSLTGSTSAALPTVSTYSGNGSIQIQAPGTVLSNTSGTYGGAIGAPGGGLQIQLNSLNLPFNKFDVTQSTPAYPATNSFATAIGATKNGSYNGYLQINAPISGSSDVVFTSNATTGGGAGVTLLNAQCTYTGTTLIEGNGGVTSGYNGGSLILGTSNALPAGTDVEFGDFNGKPSHNPMIDVNGFNQQIGSLSSNAASLTYAASDNFYIANNAVGTLATLTVSGAATPYNAYGGFLVDNTLGSGGTLALVKGGPNTLVLANSNSFSGGTTVTSGVLQLGNSRALGLGGVTMTGGSIDLAGNSVTVPKVTGPAGTITNSGLVASTLTINLSDTSTFGGSITDGAAQVALAIQGVGTLRLTGSSSYSGGTTLNAGTLIVANTVGSALGSGNLVLNGGTLEGDGGSIAGSVVAGSGPHTIAPGGGLGGTGTLILSGGVSLNGNSTLDFDIANSSSDLLQIGGALNASGLVNLDINTSGTLAGNYTLATYSPTSNVVPADFNVSGVPANYSLNVTSDALTLTAVPEPSTLVLLIAGTGAVLACRRRRQA